METALSIIPAGSERLAELEPLWAAMHDHHSGLPGMPPTRPVHDSWRRRRGQYARWLSAGDAHLLIAEIDGVAVGYAMLRLDAGAPTWEVGERVAEIESLSVSAAQRGAGIGSMLIAAARDAAHRAGAVRLLVSVAHSNIDALRFYERQEFEPFYVQLIERPKSAPASRHSD